MDGGLIERRKAEARATETAIRAALADLPGDAVLTVPELAARIGRPVSTVRERVAELERQRLVCRTSPRGPVRLTTEGRLTASPAGQALALTTGAQLGQVLRMLPCEAYRAMLRLLLAAVVARHHLRAVLPDTALWPSFIAIGDTGHGKTLMARIVCRLLGLPERTITRQVPAATPGQIIGRTERNGSGWRVVPSPLLGYPLAILDEWDKAPADVRAAAWTLLQGNATEEPEDGARVEIRPVVYAPSNARPAELARMLDRAYLSRAVVLSTWSLADLLTDVDLTAAALADPAVVPRLPALDSLVPPVTTLPAEVVRWMRDGLRSALTPDGWNLTRVESLALLPAGLAALYPANRPAGERVEMAAIQVVLDYLTVTATLDGLVQPDWSERAAGPQRHLAAWAAGSDAGDMLPDLDAGQAEHAARAERERQRAVERVQVVDDLRADRHRLAAVVDEALAALDGRRTGRWLAADRVEARALRPMLAELRAEAAGSRSRAALDAIGERVRVRLAEVDALVARVDQRRADRDRAREQAELDERQRRTVAAEYRRQAKERDREIRNALREIDRKLDRTQTRPGEDVLGWLVDQGVVTAQDRVQTITHDWFPGNRFRRLAGLAEKQPYQTRHPLRVYVAQDRRVYRADQLTAWELPAVQAVLTVYRTAVEEYAASAPLAIGAA